MIAYPFLLSVPSYPNPKPRAAYSKALAISITFTLTLTLPRSPVRTELQNRTKSELANTESLGAGKQCWLVLSCSDIVLVLR